MSLPEEDLIAIDWVLEQIRERRLTRFKAFKGYEHDVFRQRVYRWARAHGAVRLQDFERLARELETKDGIALAERLITFKKLSSDVLHYMMKQKWAYLHDPEGQEPCYLIALRKPKERT